MRRFRPVLFLLLGATALAAPRPAGGPMLPLDELQPGMKGEVWTVFKGTEPEPFSVEVTGVVRNALGPGKSLILCELTDERVQKMGAVAGMSGSPLYIDGRLAGALAYQVQKFETVRYAGFTPAADLVEVSRKSDEAIAAKAAGRNPPATRPAAADRADDTLTPLAPVFAFGGIAPVVVDWLAPQFETLGLRVASLGGQAAAAGAPAPGRTLQPGDAVAVAVTTGDITLAATGTVSYVDGNRVVAFGHPMMGLGEVALPMARSEIVAILPSNLNSLKVANTGEIIGTISQDRLSAVAGEIGAAPAMLPVEIAVTGPGTETRYLRFAAARHPQLTPLVIGAGTAQAVLGSNDAGFTNGARIEATFAFPHGASVPTTSLVSGPQGITQGLTEFVRDIGAVLQNPYEDVVPASIHVRVTPLAVNPQTTLEYVRLSHTVISPGTELAVTVGWRDHQGAAAAETIHIPVPAAWQGRNLELVAANGAVLDQLTGRDTAVTAAQFRSLEALLERVRLAREPDGLYLAVVEGGRAFVDQSDLTRDLPASYERIANRADEARYQSRPALEPLWETHRLPGRLIPATVRRAFRVTD
ncbi:MAG: hypothetical protein KF897_16820 [Opitutaceae bacterium]|nr:hypothetical protein [Opitutaceae bacterium]